MTFFELYRPLRAVSISTAALLSVWLGGAAQAAEEMAFMNQPEDASLLGDYLAGTYANYLDDSGARSKFYTRAFEADPTNVNIGRRAVTSALTAGDFKKATELAEEVYAVDETESMALSVLAVNAFEQGKHKDARKFLDPNTADITMGIVMAFTKGWNEYEVGKVKAARTAFEQQAARPYFGELAKLQLANLEALENNRPAADEAFEGLKIGRAHV